MMEETTPKQTRKPRPRQRKGAIAVVKNLLSDKPLPTGQVLESVGYSKTLSEQPSRIIESPGFQAALAETGLKAALIRQGITPEKIAERISVLLAAKKPISKFSHESGETELIGEQDDYQAIDKGLTHATKIYGILDESPKVPSGNTYNIIFTPGIKEKVQIFEAEIKEMLTKPHVPKD